MSAPTPFGLSRIGQIAVPVRDLDRAVTFYREALGLPFLFRVPGLAFFDCAGVRLMLAAPETAEEERSGATIYFRGDDIQQAHAALQARDVIFEDAPHLIARLETVEVWMAFFRDPDRNLLAAMSEAPLAQPVAGSTRPHSAHEPS